MARDDGVSVKSRIKKMILRDPGITTDEILTELARKGGKDAPLPSRFLVDGIRNDTRQTLRLLKQAGLLADGVQI